MTDDDADPPAGTDGTSHGLERLVFFSDAVMAIALTLLAIDLPLPPTGLSNAGVWRHIHSLLLHDYLSFAISFVVIAAFWMSHHRFFNHVRHVDNGLVRLTMVFLFAIVTLPYFTRLHGEQGIGQQAGTVLYAAAVALVGSSLIACVWYARRAGLLREVGTWRASGVIRSLALLTAAFLISIPIAFANTSLAEWSWLVIPVVTMQVLRVTRRIRRRAAPTA